MPKTRQELEAQIEALTELMGMLDDDACKVIKNQISHYQSQLGMLNAPQHETMYQHLSRIVGYSEELKACIESTVDQLLNEDVANATEPGLLLGKIQCGKTRAFVGVMGLAFDRGIDVCVVITKSDNGLVKQTKARMEYEFRNFISATRLDQYCVVAVHEIQHNLHFSPAQINNQKNIFVVHKNSRRLKALINLFSQTNFRNKKVLVVDDEADFVSRAFYQRNAGIEVGRIALLIDNFVKIPTFCRYLQVTATPYSLFLQPDHTVSVNNGEIEAFRPRFTTLVPIHANYIGGKHYFVLSQNNQSMYSYLKHIVSEECISYLLVENQDRRVYDNAGRTPKYTDLRQALMSYFVASAIRQLQEETLHGKRYSSSFFMHISTRREDHTYEQLIVENILKFWSDDIRCNSGEKIQAEFLNAYVDFQSSNLAGNTQQEIHIYMPTQEDVWKRIVNIFSEVCYSVIIVNSSNSENLLGQDGQLNLSNLLNIFIGGFKLDRGITIDHMLGFMYGRSPQVQQADTVLQHHRMYGNRSKEDMAVTRLHTTQSLYDKMEWIDNMDHQLRKILVESINNPQGSTSLLTIQYDAQLGIVPCNRNRLLISDLETFESFKRLAPFGFQTDSATKIKPIIDELDSFLSECVNYKVAHPFLIDKSDAYKIIKKIRSTFIYSRKIDNNIGMEWNENEMIVAIENCVPDDAQLWCYVVIDRNMGRVRQNGNFVDAPEDGNRDTPVAREYTQTEPSRPFLMLFRENGKTESGWRGSPFYWPALRLPQDIKTCIYCK